MNQWPFKMEGNPTCKFHSTYKLNHIRMKKLERIVASKLLKIKAVKLQPSNPFTWASGWKSPIYCDNRKTLSYPALRNFIKLELARLIRENYDQADAIAGVATGAIAQGAMVAEELGLPFVYVRSSPKDHGLENLIEGDLKPGMKVIVIEDLISTGGSSLKAVEAIRADGSEVIGMLAIFTYGFPVAEEAFKKAKVELTTLSNYEAVLETALATNYIHESELTALQEWRKSPTTWEPK
jgi:orotate phosphoribosyltransferase